MTLHIPIPADVDPEMALRLDLDAREAVAVRLYREGRMSHGQFAEYLRIDRAQAEEVLGRHGVVDYTAERVTQEAASIRARLGR